MSRDPEKKKAKDLRRVLRSHAGARYTLLKGTNEEGELEEGVLRDVFRHRRHSSAATTFGKRRTHRYLRRVRAYDGDEEIHPPPRAKFFACNWLDVLWWYS